jgi:hypothetical protein
MHCTRRASLAAAVRPPGSPPLLGAAATCPTSVHPARTTTRSAHRCGAIAVRKRVAAGRGWWWLCIARMLHLLQASVHGAMHVNAGLRCFTHMLAPVTVVLDAAIADWLHCTDYND